MADKILVADDEGEARELLSSFLTGEGYEVILAENGEEALELSITEKPNVVLLDVSMPGIDGIEACQKLKAGKKTRLIPVIMATAFRDSYMEAFNAGADDFVTKPFHLLELSVRIKSILRILHLTDELERAMAYTNELIKDLPIS